MVKKWKDMDLEERINELRGWAKASTIVSLGLMVWIFILTMVVI